MDSILEDLVDENSLDDNLDDTISEMFTDEHALDYSSLPLWDDYDDNLLIKREPLMMILYDDPLIFFRFEGAFVFNQQRGQDFNPPLFELPFHKEVPGLGALTPRYSSEKRGKSLQHLGSKLLKEFINLSSSWNYTHQGTKHSKSPQNHEIPEEICSHSLTKETIRNVLDVPCLHFYPP
ncbi:hypothetical protein Tco_0690673 [Tanacetum coccineum]